MAAMYFSFSAPKAPPKSRHNTNLTCPSFVRFKPKPLAFASKTKMALARGDDNKKPLSFSLNFGTSYSKSEEISPAGGQEKELRFETDCRVSAPLPFLNATSKPSTSIQQFNVQLLSLAIPFANVLINFTKLLKNSNDSGGDGGGDGGGDRAGDGTANMESPRPHTVSVRLRTCFVSSDHISPSGYIKETRFAFHGNVSASLAALSSSLAALSSRLASRIRHNFIPWIIFVPVLVQLIIASITKIGGGGHADHSSVGAVDKVLLSRIKPLASLDCETFVFNKEKIILAGHGKVFHFAIISP